MYCARISLLFLMRPGVMYYVSQISMTDCQLESCALAKTRAIRQSVGWVSWDGQLVVGLLAHTSTIAEKGLMGE